MYLSIHFIEKAFMVMMEKQVGCVRVLDSA